MKESQEFELPSDDDKGKGDINPEQEAKKQENLKQALLEIKERGVSVNVLFFLHQAGELEMERMLLDVATKRSMDAISNKAKELIVKYEDTIIRFIVGTVTHVPYSEYMYAKSIGATNRPYFISLAKLLAKLFEISENSYFNASRLYGDLGDEAKSNELRKIAREQQEKDICISQEEQMTKLIKFKPEIITAVESFIEEAKDDPALMIDAEMITNEVVSRIEGKLS